MIVNCMRVIFSNNAIDNHVIAIDELYQMLGQSKSDSFETDQKNQAGFFHMIRCVLGFQDCKFEEFPETCNNATNFKHDNTLEFIGSIGTHGSIL